jgi:hypothetical protein
MTISHGGSKPTNPANGGKNQIYPRSLLKDYERRDVSPFPLRDPAILISILESGSDTLSIKISEW